MDWVPVGAPSPREVAMIRRGVGGVNRYGARGGGLFRDVGVDPRGADVNVAQQFLYVRMSQPACRGRIHCQAHSRGPGGTCGRGRGGAPQCRDRRSGHGRAGPLFAAGGRAGGVPASGAASCGGPLGLCRRGGRTSTPCDDLGCRAFSRPVKSPAGPSDCAPLARHAPRHHDPKETV